MAGPINFAVWQTQQAGTTVIETENVSVSEGADIETTNLSSISLSATVATVLLLPVGLVLTFLT